MVKSALLSKLALGLSLLLISSVHAFADDSQQPTTLVFGISPNENSDSYSKYWEMLVEQVSLISGQNIRLETSEDAEEFETKLSQGAFDFVLLNAHMYTQAHDAMGYNAFAKEKDHKDKGVIVVHRDSNIKSLADLKSQTMGLSDPRRFTSTVLTRAHLNQEGIPVKMEMVESDKAVYRAVVQGDVVAGAGEVHSLNDINPNANSKLRVIWSSQQYSSNAFAAHPRVSSEQLERVRGALIELDNDPKGKRLLANVKFKGIASASDEEWNDIRALKRHLSR